MNTSFSKKRYIAEVNQRLEERYLSNKITIEEQTTPIPGYNAPMDTQLNVGKLNLSDNDWLKYPCVTEMKNKKKIKSDDGYHTYHFSDQTGLYLIFYSNGLVLSKISKESKTQRNNFCCVNGTIKYGADCLKQSENQSLSPGSEVKTGESKPAKKLYNSAKDIKSSTEEGVRTIKNDPYEYKLIECVWHFRKGPKNVKDWKSLANNQEAKNILNSKFPNDIKDCPKSTSSAYQSQDSEIDPKYQDTPSPASSASPTTSKDVFRKAMSNVPDYPKPDEKVY